MMTIHGAKGLEFHYVFIAGLGKSKSKSKSISILFVHFFQTLSNLNTLFKY